MQGLFHEVLGPGSDKEQEPPVELNQGMSKLSEVGRRARPCVMEQSPLSGLLYFDQTAIGHRSLAIPTSEREQRHNPAKWPDSRR